MKYLLVFLLFVSCGHPTSNPIKDGPKISKTFPRVVHNNCTDKYAVQFDDKHFFGARTFWDDMYVTIPNEEELPRISIRAIRDSSLYSELGYEFQFKDSAIAFRSYLAFYKECIDSETIANRKIDSVIHANFVKDSIFKCQHNYQ